MAARAKRAAFVTQLTLQNVKSFLGAHTLDLTDEDGGPARWTLILGDNGVGKTTLLECLAHLAPIFNSNDQVGSEDPEMFIEPRVAAAPNSVIDDLGRNGDIEFRIEATFAVDSQLNGGDVANDTVETWMTFSRKGGNSDNIKTSDWGKDKKVADSKWKEFSKFREPLILAYGAGRHMGVGNLDFSKAPQATDSLLQGTVELFDAEELLLQRLSGPIGENGMAQIQDRFIQKRHKGKNRQLDFLRRVAAFARLRIRHFDGLAHLVAKTQGIGDCLPVRAQPPGNSK